MSVSGVTINSDCVSKFNQLKLGKDIAFIIFQIVDNKEINVENVSKSREFNDFLNEIPEAHCRYAIIDFQYDLGEGQRNKITFVSWSPDAAPIKEKMVYASSKDALRRALSGVAAEVQATDYDELSYDTVLDKCTRR